MTAVLHDTFYSNEPSFYTDLAAQTCCLVESVFEREKKSRLYILQPLVAWFSVVVTAKNLDI